MTWDAVGAIAELLRSSGVILILLYLSRQIENNSKQLEGSALVAITEYERSMLEDIFANEKLWDVIKRGNGDWDSLNEEDQSLYAVRHQRIRLLGTSLSVASTRSYKRRNIQYKRELLP